VTNLLRWIVCVCALLTAGEAQAQAGNRVYAAVGPWEIAAEPADKFCTMSRFYTTSQDGSTEGLAVRFDAAKETVWLRWSTTGSTPFFKDGEIDLFVNFFKDKSMDESWGSRTFRHGKLEDTRYFVNVFNGPAGTRRILRDLAGNKLIGLNLGPVLLTALSLDAGDATETLRRCSTEIAGLPAAVSSPK